MKQQLLDLIEYTVFACGVEYVHICAKGLAHIHLYRSDEQVVIYGYYNTTPTKSYGIVDRGELYSLLTNPNLLLIKQDGNLLAFQNAKSGNSVDYSFVSKKRIAASLPDDYFEKLRQQAKIIGEDISDRYRKNKS